jgi:hypothetical protein
MPADRPHGNSANYTMPGQRFGNVQLLGARRGISVGIKPAIR